MFASSKCLAQCTILGTLIVASPDFIGVLTLPLAASAGDALLSA
jgi:hypothetical protein